MLTKRTPDKGAYNVSDEVDGYGQHLLLLGCNTPFCSDLGNGHARQGRAHGGIDDEHAANEDDSGLLGL